MGMRRTGGSLAVLAAGALAFWPAGSPSSAAASPSLRGTEQAAQRTVAAAGSVLQPFSRPPVATGLSGVSCPSTSLCMAVGISLAHLATDIWNGRAWHGLVTPAPAHALGLYAVSCAGRAQCMATGSKRSGGTSFAFAESWNGRTWKMLPVAPGQDTLTGISCPALARCMAVGHTGPLAAQSPSAAAEMWDGSSWSALPMPAIPGAQSATLSAVSCTSDASCIAVGSYVSSSPQNPVFTLAEVWDGTSWQLQATPSPDISRNLLTGISCASASSCVTVGSSGATLTALTEQWDGHSWSVVEAAIPAGARESALDGVSCSSAHACMAVGSYEDTSTQRRVLTERWDGAGWRLHAASDPFPYPDDNSLGSVSCPAADGCMAVGSPGFDSLAEQWDGHSWQVRRSGQIDVLAGVSCVSSDRCMAAGGSVSRADREVTLAEAWNGRRWRQRATPTPVPFAGLSDTSCTGPAFCMAVGGFAENQLRRFAERWDGTRWRTAGTPPVFGNGSVSCASATRCMAVGGEAAAAWNGGRWSPVRVAVPRAGAGNFTLTDVSCPSATRCIAVGTSVTGDHFAHIHAVAEEWNGRRWRILATPVLEVEYLNAVDCAGPSRCMAVGWAGRAGSLAERWNGRTWRAQTQLGPASYPGLRGVSCPRAAACIAVGLGAAEQWNGRTWRVVKPAGRSAALLGVSCARPRRCIAVGQAGTLTFAEQWNGTRWQQLRTRNP